ncbi:MAG TPA: TonB-dependent receptor [Bryobacteraceae bacterium]|nr:TonB-dependent receptor [Bryobacteraceae bacterium]
MFSKRALTIVALLCSTAVFGQEFRGSILGRITDSSGAIIAGAMVRARNVDTNALVSTTSNETGNYQIPFLLPGSYVVEVEHAGFKKLERQGVRVSTSQQITLDLTLDVGAASESVTVTASAPALNLANAELGQVIDNAYVGMVSVSLSRNVVNLRSLAPGVTGDTGTYTSSAQANFSIAGGGSGQGKNDVIVDGMPNTTGSGTIGYIPSVDSVEEVKVHTTMFDASLGHSNAGALSITTRGGTNELHGAVYGYKRWRDLNANSWTNNRLGLDKPPVEYHQWGYTVGGPILIPKLYNGRNRTFFSTSLERDHDPRELTGQARVPTAAERQGDFSQTLNRVGGAFAIYDPSTTVVSGSTATRQAFAGNRIPASRISPIGAAVLGKLPLPNQQTGAVQLAALNWAESKTYTVDQRQVGARIDHILSDRQRLSGRIGILNRFQIADDLFPGIFSYPGATDLGSLVRHRVNFSVDDTFVLSPTLVGSIRLGALSYTSDTQGGAVGADPKDLLVPDVIANNQAVRGWSTFDLGENLAGIGSSKSFSREMVYTGITTWTKLSGRHSTKFGADYRLSRANSVAPGANATGSFVVGPTFTQSDPFNRTAANTSGSGMASLLLGGADSGNFGYNTATSIQNNYLGLFVQNDWKVTPRFTLNLGLRYELETPYKERYDRNSYKFDRDATLPVKVPGLDLRGGILFAGINGNPRSIDADKNNFGPRVGFAYSPSQNTVIRGGYGIFYSTIALTTSFFGAVNVFNAVTPFVGSIDNGATIAATLANPYPAGLIQPVGNSVGLLAQVGDTLSFFDDKRVNPYNQQWQLSVQRQLPARIVFEIAYMGMHNLRQIENFNLNEKPDRFLALGRAENNAVPNPFLGVFPATSTLGRGATITQSRLWPMFPQFTTLTGQGFNTGQALYHSLQMKADKRLSGGLNMLWAYTFSRLMDNNTTSIVNARHYRAVSLYDQKHVMRLAFTYQLPFRFKSMVLRQAAGGWAVSGFGTLASGVPLSVTQANGRPIRLVSPKLTGSVGSRLGDKRDAGGNVLNPYFNTGAFLALPDQYTLSPEPPALDDLRAPGTRSLNMAVFKAFPIRERFKLEVRMEATSVTNTPIFDAPGTNMSQTSTFGVIRSAGGNRAVQGSARFVF